jgi:hypothetical protein
MDSNISYLNPKGFSIKFQSCILDNSDEKTNFKKACQEWSQCEYHSTFATHCICGNYITKVYSIQHYSGKDLSPIGSSCIKNIALHNYTMNNSLNIAIEKQKKIDAQLKITQKLAKKIYLLNGKYKGKTYEYLINNEPNYCKWILQQKWFLDQNINKDFINFCTLNNFYPVTLDNNTNT